MSDPRDPHTSAPGGADSPESVEDDGFGRRIGIALAVSIGLNVLLLQGAGTLAKNMTVSDPVQPDITVTLRETKVALASPTPTPTPTPVAATPTPTPAPESTPTPEPARPTPMPTPERNLTPTPEPTPSPRPEPTPVPSAQPTPRPTPVPTPRPQPTTRPVATPTPEAVPTPPPTERNTPTETRQNVVQELTNRPNTVQTPQTDIAPMAATTPRERSTLSNNRPRLGSIPKGSSGGVIAVTPRNTAAAGAVSPNDFVVPSSSVSRAPTVNPLPETRTSIVDKLFGGGTSAKVQVTNTPDVQSTLNETTRQPMTNGGVQRKALTGRTNVMTAPRTSETASPDFTAVPGGAVAPGRTIAAQGGSRTSTVATSVSGAATIISGSPVEASVSAPGLASGRGPIGVNRNRGKLSKLVGVSPNERTGTNIPGATFEGVAGTGNVLSRAGTVKGTATARYNPNASFNPNLQGGGGGAAGVIAGNPGGGGSGEGRVGRLATGGGGGRGRLRGRLAGSGGVGTAGERGGGEGVAAGVPNGVAGGTGNGERFQAGARTGGVVNGIAGGTGTGTIRGGGGIQAAEGGTAVGERQTKVSFNAGDTDFLGGGAGSRVNPQRLSEPNVIIPESMRRQKFNVRASVKVTVFANGQHRAEIVSGTGFDALDRAIVSALNATRFKPGTVDGKPVDANLQFSVPVVQN
jgi:TonB family protein